MKLKFMHHFLPFREDLVCKKKKGKTKKKCCGSLLLTPVLENVMVWENQQCLMDLTGLPEPQSWDRAGGGIMLSAEMSSAGLSPLHCSDLGIFKLSVSVTEK